jgi:hypothetical protein
MKTEIWKDVIGYEGSYQVSNLGRVKSLKCNRKKILKLSINSVGYLRVNLCKNKRSVNRTIHQLVAESFLNHVPNGYKLVVDHINNNKLDNRVDNLRITTNRENTYKIQFNYSSKYKGVCWHKKNNKWISRISINGKNKTLGCFVNEFDAHLAYQTALNTLI